jgi:hypothetical protein
MDISYPKNINAATLIHSMRLSLSGNIITPDCNSCSYIQESASFRVKQLYKASEPIEARSRRVKRVPLALGFVGLP